MKVCCVFFDIQAAFDKVWHQDLICKLCKLKFPLYLIDWVWNFLTERRFRVLVGDYRTEYFDITCGTPQGAVTSPTLFSIYINDIPLDDMKNDSYSLLFSDDLMKMKIFPKINEEIERQINKYLIKIQKWLNTWRLKMCPEKCFYTIFSQNLKSGKKGTKGIKRERMELYLYDVKIDTKNDPLFLGMRFDKYMNFKN